ncbi:MAG: hypothetical protein ACLT98_06460 [Eggerthellaceae bacterium]
MCKRRGAFVSSCLIAAEGEVALVVAQVFAPYFLTVGGCLAVARRMGASGAFAASVAWGSIGGGGCLWFGNQVLLGLRDGFLVDMGIVVVAAAAWMLFEARRWLSDMRFSPRVLAFDSSYVNR